MGSAERAYAGFSGVLVLPKARAVSFLPHRLVSTFDQLPVVVTGQTFARVCGRGIAKFLMPGKNKPLGFILTTLLGVVGAFVATYLGQALGWYRADEGAGLIGAVVGAIIVLAIWGFIARSRSSA
jgi:uncharacterized membrane protein YeaQ/YmgE (transglycosylase-associated protein family)